MKTIVAALLGAIAYFFLGWLIWGILLMDMMSQYSNASCTRPAEEMNMSYLVGANLIWGLVYAYIFSNWPSARSFQAGLLPGAIITILIGIGFDLSTMAMTTLSTSTTPMLINIPANAVVGAIVGGVICWWLGRGGGSRGIQNPT